MIILKIKESGHVINLPGMNSVRTPVDIDISKLDIRLVISYLTKAGITRFEIKEKGIDKKIEKHKDNSKKEEINNELNERLERIETLLVEVTKKGYSNNKLNKEQTINETISSDKLKNIVLDEMDDKVESFIPEISTEDMRLNSSDNIKKVKKNEGSEDSANILAGLIKK